MVALMILFTWFSRAGNYSMNNTNLLWRGGRVVEGTGLENRQACKRFVGSNPTLSAKFLYHNPLYMIDCTKID